MLGSVISITEDAYIFGQQKIQLKMVGLSCISSKEKPWGREASSWVGKSFSGLGEDPVYALMSTVFGFTTGYLCLVQLLH